jgi:Uma2 family endonuclease
MDQHSEPTRHVSGWLCFYQVHAPGVRGGDNPTVCLDLDNEPQPDCILYLPQKLGGQAASNEKGYLTGAPEFVCEVAASSASYDLHDKLPVYRRNQVREYVVWRTLDQAIDWFVWREGEYRPVAPDAEGLLKSESFPGLWLDPAALIRGDLPALFAALQRGLSSPEHATFVAQLQRLATATGDKVTG